MVLDWLEWADGLSPFPFPLPLGSLLEVGDEPSECVAELQCPVPVLEETVAVPEGLEGNVVVEGLLTAAGGVYDTENEPRDTSKRRRVVLDGPD